MTADEISIYVHIPYCRNRCVYCDFFSTSCAPIPVGEYVSLVKKEALLRQDWLQGKRIVSLYLGGGTPSLIPGDELAGLLDALGSASIDEVTVEVNPGDAHRNWFREMVRSGVTRFSIGAQAFREERLGFLGRRHGVPQIAGAVELARDAGALSVGLDLIYGTPGQTAGELSGELDDLLALRPDHVSAYELTISESTPLGRRAALGEFEMPDEQILIEMWSLVGRRLEHAGLPRYEVSNYGRAGHHSRQNMGYWTGRPYVALGAGAHGMIVDGSGRRLRYANTPNIEDYVRSLSTSDGRGAVGHQGSEEWVPSRDHAAELVFLGLRTSGGVSIDALENLLEPRVFQRWYARLNACAQRGHLRLTKSSCIPTEQGMLLADSIAQDVVD